ncbi:MAG: hypothetical protein ACI9ON_004299, partial [Limisphaerales bacterium]
RTGRKCLPRPDDPIKNIGVALVPEYNDLRPASDFAGCDTLSSPVAQKPAFRSLPNMI